MGKKAGKKAVDDEDWMNDAQELADEMNGVEKAPPVVQLGKKGLKAQRDREAAAAAEEAAEQARQEAEAGRRAAAAAERAAAAAAKKEAAAAEEEAARSRLAAAAEAAAERKRRQKAESEAARAESEAAKAESEAAEPPPEGPSPETAASRPERDQKKGRDQPTGWGQREPPPEKQASSTPQDATVEPVLVDALPHQSNVAAGSADVVEQWLASPCGGFRRWEGDDQCVLDTECGR